MAFWDDWAKRYIKKEIDTLLKADGVSVPTSGPMASVPASADAVPDSPEKIDDAAKQIGRKAIIDDPYYDLVNAQVNYKTKLSRISNKTLKEVSLRDWLVSTIIQNRIDTLMRFAHPEHRKFEMGFRCVKRNSQEHYTDEEKQEIANLEDFIYNCGRKEGTPIEDRRTFGDFLKMIGRDAMTFGHVAVEKVKTRSGGLHRFRPIPGESTYLVNKNLSRSQIDANAVNSQQFTQPRSDNDPRKDQQVNTQDNEYIKYVQVSQDNRPLATFGDEDMIFKLFNPQNFVDSMGYCYAPGTAYVLLADGSIKLVEDIKIGDRVVTHTGEVKPVYELKNRKYTGNMFTITPNGMMPQVVTGEHPLYVLRYSRADNSLKTRNTSFTPEWIAAKDISIKDRLVVPKLVTDESYRTIDTAPYRIGKRTTVPRYLPLDSELGWLIGLYAGDGCIVNNKTIRFDLGPNEQYLAKKVQKILAKYGVNVTYRMGATCLNVHVYSAVLARTFADLVPGKASTKKINSKLLNATKSALTGILCGYIESDGSIAHDGGITASSVSPDLAFGIANIVNRLGALAKINVKHDKRSNRLDSYEIKIPQFLNKLGVTSLKKRKLTDGNRKMYMEDNKAFYVTIKDINIDKYSGSVYNFEVKDNHSYIANQVVSHNCYGPLEMAIITVTNHLNVESYNANFFTHGYAARGILHLKGTVTQQQLLNFRRTFYNSISGQQHAWRTPIVAGMDDVQWVPMSASAREMEYINFNNHLMRILCAQFQIDPIELGLDYLVSGTGRVATQQANNEYKIAYSRERGLLPILFFVEDLVNTHIMPALDKDLAAKYKFIFTGYTDETPQTEIAQLQAEVTVWKSLNDVLAQAQKDRIDTPAADLPMNQAFWALVEKNYTRGEIREKFFGDKGAAQRKELQYIPGDPAFLQWNQLLATFNSMKEQKKQQKQQQEQMMQQQEAEQQQEQEDKKRDVEKHEVEMEQLRSQAAMNAVKHGSLHDTAKQFGATKAAHVGGNVVANPINKIPEEE